MADFNIAVLGYGPQGEAWAKNLRDSGNEPVIGLPSRPRSRRKARADGFKRITTPALAVKEADIVIFAFPDHLQRDEYRNNLSPNLKKNAALVFLHGFAIHFGLIDPPDTTDIILLAPLGPGNAVRESYLKNDSIGYFYTIHQNGSGCARKTLDHMVHSLKIDRNRLIKTSFRDEAIGDLFGEQSVLCGGLTELIMAGFETLREAGLSADKAYLEIAYQLDLIIDLIKRYGMKGMYDRISIAARFGSSQAGPEVIGPTVRTAMKRRLKKIENGTFANELNNLNSAELKKLEKKISLMTSPEFDKAARHFAPRIKPRLKK